MGLLLLIRVAVAGEPERVWSEALCWNGKPATNQLEKQLLPFEPAVIGLPSSWRTHVTAIWSTTIQVDYVEINPKFVYTNRVKRNNVKKKQYDLPTSVATNNQEDDDDDNNCESWL